MMNTVHSASATPMRSIATDKVNPRHEPVRVDTAATATVTAPVQSTAIAFDISRGGHAFTMTLSDRVSGDVLLKLVYDHGGVLHPTARAKQGQFIDIAL